MFWGGPLRFMPAYRRAEGNSQTATPPLTYTGTDQDLNWCHYLLGEGLMVSAHLPTHLTLPQRLS